MARISRNRLLRMSAGAQVGLELVELFVEVGSGEAVAERVEDVVGGLTGVVEPGELDCGTRLRRGESA